jgi:hypothetical protein
MVVACSFWARQFLCTEEDGIGRLGARVTSVGVG